MAYNQDKQIRNMRIGIGAALGGGLLLAGLQLSDAFEEMAEARSERDAVIVEIIDLTGQARDESKALAHEIDAYLNGKPPPSNTTPNMDLCNNYYFRGLRPCTNIELHDGTVVRVEDGSASQFLIETIDGLRSGEIESMIEEPLPIEETDPLMLYEFTG